MIINNQEGTLDFKYILDSETKTNFAYMYSIYFSKIARVSKIIMPSYIDYVQKLYEMKIFNYSQKYLILYSLLRIRTSFGKQKAVKTHYGLQFDKFFI
jgi:hypothetical protein